MPYEDLPFQECFGTFRAICRTRRIVVAELELFLSVGDAQICLARAADVKSSLSISWGNITPTEARTLAQADESSSAVECLDYFLEQLTSNSVVSFSYSGARADSVF